MCGRFSQTKKKQEIKKRFNVKKVPDGVENLFNLAPDRDIPVILNESPDEISLVRWNLLPSWAKKEKTPYSMINARAETLLEKTSYKRLITKKRCLIIADGFYEWQNKVEKKGKKEVVKKIPYRIFLKNDEPFAFAGLWDLWEKDDKHILSCTIITTTPNKLVASIHDRMPVILDPEDEAGWLQESTPINRVLAMLRPYPVEKMEAYQISTLVNSPINNTAEIIKPI